MSSYNDQTANQGVHNISETALNRETSLNGVLTGQTILSADEIPVGHTVVHSSDDVLVEECEETEVVVEEDGPTLRCIECDIIVELDSREKHTINSCESILKKPFRCGSCSLEFNFSENLYVHSMMTHFDEALYTEHKKCDLCLTEETRGRRFHAFLAHVKTHAIEDNYICKICFEPFDHLATFHRHMRRSHEGLEVDELAFCPRCQDAVAVEDVLSHVILHISHRKIGAKESITRKRKREPSVKGKDLAKRHKCKLCEKSFSRPAELKRHVAVHIRKEDPSLPKWKCAICGKQYSHRTGLNEHKRTVHGNSKPIVCQLCGLVFTKQSNLDRHVKRQHPLDSNSIDKYPYECVECPSVFSNFVALVAHRSRHHEFIAKKNEDYTCRFCNYKFKQKEMLKRHIKQQHDAEKKRTLDVEKSFECQRCLKRFMLRSSLLLHLDMHRRRDDMRSGGGAGLPLCTICGFEFYYQGDLTRHMLQHKTFKCQRCEMEFQTKAFLKNHLCEKENMIIVSRQQIDTPVRRVPSNVDLAVAPLHRVTSRVFDSNRRVAPLRSFNKITSRASKRHLCWTCHKSFRTAELLSLHQVVHNQDPFRCEYCRITLYGRKMYLQHLHTVHQHREDVGVAVVDQDRQNAASAQSFAEYGLKTMQNANEIVRAQSVDWTEAQVEQNEAIENVDMMMFRKGPIRCDVCQHLYDNIRHLIDHWNGTTSEREHSFAIVTCPVCGVRVRGASEAAFHLSQQHFSLPTYSFMQPVKVVQETVPVAKHLCSTCNKQFGKKSDLARHEMIHTGERPFMCNSCDARFRTRHAAVSHMAIHTENFSPTDTCMVCNKKFFSKRALKLHLRIHTGEKPLMCNYCPDTFRTSSQRQKHEKRVHADAKKRGFDSSQQVALKAPTNNPKPEKRKMKLGQATSSTVVAPIRPSFRTSQLTAVPVVDDAFSRTASQITRLAPQQLRLSRQSAFSAPSNLVMRTKMESFLYIVAKKISVNEYFVSVGNQKPLPDSMRPLVDTVSELSMEEMRSFADSSATISVVLHDALLLNVDTQLLMQIIDDQNFVSCRTKISSGPPTIREMFRIVADAGATFVRRCEVCEVDLPSRETSDAHFASEDHETAVLMHPVAVVETTSRDIQSPQAVPLTRRDDLSDFTCKLCGRKFLDLEPLVAHIRREHERDAELLPPRPAAHTAPIH